MIQPDFGLTAQDYATHRAGFPASLFDRLAGFDIGHPGQRIVDLGTGTGNLARGFARRRCVVVGIDPAEALMEQARRLDAAEGLRVDYRTGRAEETGLPAAYADVVAAGQCWHWFDGSRAAAEAARILRRDGKLLITHFDWLPLRGNVVDATEKLIEAHNPKWSLGGGMGLYPQWLRQLGEAGYRDLETFSYDVAVPYSHESWRGRVRASAGVGGSLPDDLVRAFDGALAAVLETRYPGNPIDVPHRVFALIARPSAST